jgi:uncharacterized protein DUF4430
MNSISFSPPRPRAALAWALFATSLAAVGALTATAEAQPVAAGLRVEASTTTLAPEVTYLSDTARLQTDTRPACGGSGNPVTAAGPTALGLLAFAGRDNGRLRPLGVSDRFSFGLFVCGVGDFVGGNTSYWLYKVNHVSPEVGGEQFALKSGDQVLWYFVDSTAGRNTGDELELVAPVRARPDQSFEVKVNTVSSSGKRTPAAGAEVAGESVQVTNAQGKARVFVDHDGLVKLRATRRPDVASPTVAVCVNAHLSRCSAVRGQQIVGTDGRDSIVGSAGPDLVRARDSRDRVNVRGGGRDRVSCGDGVDRVRADRGDRLSSDCEEVFRA